jgi:hypothetical protein
MQALQFKSKVVTSVKSSSGSTSPLEEFSEHPWWELGTNWKSALNNLRLVIHPDLFWGLIEPWLRVFPIPGIKRCCFKLIGIMNNFRASPIEYAMAS